MWMVMSMQWKPSGDDSIDVNLKLPEECVVCMTRMGLSPSLGTQRRILDSRNNLSMEIVKKDLWQEILRLKAQQAQQPQGYLAVNSPAKTAGGANKKKSGASTAQDL